MDKLRIHLLVDNHRYPMIIRREDEELWRIAAKQINDMLNDHRKQYPDRDPTDYWAMVAVQLAFRNLSAKNRNDTKPYQDKLKELTQELEEYIKAKE